MLLNGVVEGLYGFWVKSSSPHSTSPGSAVHPTPHPISSCVALVMGFSRDTLLELSMTLVRLNGAKSLRDPSVFQLLGEWVAHRTLAKAYVGGYPSLIRDKQIVAVRQYDSLLFPALDFIRPLMELNIPKTRFRHISEFMTRRGAAYTAASGGRCDPRHWQMRRDWGWGLGQYRRMALRASTPSPKKCTMTTPHGGGGGCRGQAIWNGRGR